MSKYLDEIGLAHFWANVKQKIEDEANLVDYTLRSNLAQPDFISLGIDKTQRIGTIPIDSGYYPQGLSFANSYLYTVLENPKTGISKILKLSYPALGVIDELVLPAAIHGNGMDYLQPADRLVVCDAKTKSFYSINPQDLKVTSVYTYTGSAVSSLAFLEDSSMAYANVTGSNNYLLFERHAGFTYTQFGTTNGSGGIGRSGRQDMCGIENYGFAHLASIIGENQFSENIVKVFSNYGSPFVTFKLQQTIDELEGLCYDSSRKVFIYTTINGDVYEADVSDFYTNVVSASEHKYGGNYTVGWRLPSREDIISNGLDYIVDCANISVIRRVDFPNCNGAGERLSESPIVMQIPDSAFVAQATSGGNIRLNTIKPAVVGSSTVFYMIHMAYNRDAMTGISHLTTFILYDISTHNTIRGNFNATSTDEEIRDFFDSLNEATNFAFSAPDTTLLGPVRFGHTYNCSIFRVK